MLEKIQNIDNKVLERILKIHSPSMNKFMILFSNAGTFGTIWWLICLPFLISRNWRLTGINFVFALAVSHIMGQMLIKNIVKRSRPCNSLSDEDLIVKRPRYYSFPSGHTMASFAFFGVAMIRCSLALSFPIFILACLISFSRIYLRVHYMTDVVCGMVLGFICGSCSVVIFNAAFPALFPTLLV